MERGGYGLEWRMDAWMGLMTDPWVLASEVAHTPPWGRRRGLILRPLHPTISYCNCVATRQECSVDENSELVLTGTQVARQKTGEIRSVKLCRPRGPTCPSLLIMQLEILRGHEGGALVA